MTGQGLLGPPLVQTKPQTLHRHFSISVHMFRQCRNMYRSLEENLSQTIDTLLAYGPAPNPRHLFTPHPLRRQHCRLCFEAREGVLNQYCYFEKTAKSE